MHRYQVQGETSCAGTSLVLKRSARSDTVVCVVSIASMGVPRGCHHYFLALKAPSLFKTPWHLEHAPAGFVIDARPILVDGDTAQPIRRHELACNVAHVQVDRKTLNTITGQVVNLVARDVMSLWRLYVKVKCRARGFTQMLGDFSSVRARSHVMAPPRNT